MAREGIASSRGHHARQRTYPGVKGRRPDNKKHRVEEAKERQEAWTKLGPKGQLAALDARARSGRDTGASKKQRARLQNLIDNPPKPIKKTKETAEVGVKPGELVVVGAETGGRLKAKDRRTTERSKRPGAEARKA